MNDVIKQRQHDFLPEHLSPNGGATCIASLSGNRLSCLISLSSSSLHKDNASEREREREKEKERERERESLILAIMGNGLT